MRSRITLALAALLVGVAVTTVLTSVLGGRTPSAAGEVDTGLFGSEHVVFRSLRPGADHGRIGYAAVTGGVPGASRLAGPRCLRVAAAAGQAICLRAGRVPTQPYEVVRLDGRLREAGDEPLNGVPSRGRVAPDGRRFATTVFVSGHDYISLGFSTETVIYQSDGEPVADLEDFTFMINGTRDESADRNVWGVTFAADSTTFFATVAASGRTYLARGDLAARTLTALQDNAECPSLSPDQTKVVYKKRVNDTSEDAWRFSWLDLRTGRESPLGEKRSVDDQVAWLDAGHVMYAVPKVADGRTAADIWVAPLDGGPPRKFIPDADSPTLVGTSAGR
ncbi:TolB-like translocation protein; signal peptide [Sphaerisporangium krabiense]|uniref:TolB-like translocation protein n=1 Tax=Sphaerisporangium krabiense TaxID=763782 RepID=A0A7W8Z789_9ACTN|nr:TolB-like translocation protein [Sphaerisporangium krabiense]MBB5628741.1 hypothetical protein [Sphaerisporangium krabiense]GII60421.1 TolB-like translocation protein; signal peptide [Sphaerisporangium krabiense]